MRVFEKVAALLLLPVVSLSLVLPNEPVSIEDESSRASVDVGTSRLPATIVDHSTIFATVPLISGSN